MSDIFKTADITGCLALSWILRHELALIGGDG